MIVHRPDACDLIRCDRCAREGDAIEIRNRHGQLIMAWLPAGWRRLFDQPSRPMEICNDCGAEEAAA